MPAVPAAKRRVPAPHYLPCLRRLRRQRGCLRSSIHNVSPSRSDDGNDDDDVLVAGLLMMIACGDGDGGVSHPFLWSGSDMYERTQHFLMLTPFSRRARGRSLRQRSGCRRVAQASGPWYFKEETLSCLIQTGSSSSLNLECAPMPWFCHNFHDACGARGDGLEGNTFRATS